MGQRADWDESLPKRNGGCLPTVVPDTVRVAPGEVGHIPASLRRGEHNLEIKIVPISPVEFHDPFYSGTLKRFPDINAESMAFPRANLLDIQVLDHRGPAGIIFHMSRCGSTLLAHFLRGTEDCLVFCEPPALNSLLMPPWGDYSENEIIGGIRIIIGLLAQAASGRRYILKLRSWNTLFAATILRALPNTPWVFLTRDPVEIAVSVMKNPSTWVRMYDSDQNPFLFALDRMPINSDSLEIYISRILGAFTRGIQGLDVGTGWLERYEQLTATASSNIAGRFGLKTGPHDFDRMATQALFYSKDPKRQTRFRPDSASKRAFASRKLIGALERHAIPDLNRLIERFAHPHEANTKLR